MKLKVLLAVPYKGNSIYELRKILSQNDVDLYVFPEGFLDSNTLTEALKIIKNEQELLQLESLRLLLLLLKKKQMKKNCLELQ